MRAARGDRAILIPLIRQWKMEKYEELRSVQVSASFCAGAAIAGMPWSKTSDALWIANALFVSSLLCAIWAIISTIQTKSILDDLPVKEDLNTSLADIEVTRARRTILRYKRTPAFQHWIMLFIWQFPSMTMAYSWVTFLLALTVHVCDPFVRRSPWSDKNKTAIVYLVIGLLGLATYIFTAVFVYMSEKDLEHYVTDTTKKRDLENSSCNHASESPLTLPTIARMSRSSKGSVSFERFREDGFVEIDLEHEGAETVRAVEGLKCEKKKKTRLTLFN
ncbi:uncharacterized protein EKO05_0004222 [Ascochyta rabiei]|uniref:Uncharacterized protein n=1 Tax=Didymella rabiei TaxID=5454 RepID=A0A162Y5F3_DIDRA|nr:uncharacterized protein EKO05_0004222 [Ascochyta rabiei]KZM19832.1 hypothetical protein ST47_g9099 [Ascochyta rabiei]UPX13723.1 hypothetical protein EKO05_0004222 [Ascochyta rabiei]